MFGHAVRHEPCGRYDSSILIRDENMLYNEEIFSSTKGITMKESFGETLGNTIVKNLAKNADVDPKKIAVGLVVTAAGTALAEVTKSVTKKMVGNALRNRSKSKEVVLIEPSKDIPESDDDKSSDED